MDDELAKKFGLESLKQLEENLEKQVNDEFQQASRVLLKKQLMDKLEKELKFELPNLCHSRSKFNSYAAE